MLPNSRESESCSLGTTPSNESSQQQQQQQQEQEVVEEVHVEMESSGSLLEGQQEVVMLKGDDRPRAQLQGSGPSENQKVNATALLKDGVTQFYRRVKEVEPEERARFRNIKITVDRLGYQVSVPVAQQIATNTQNKYTKRTSMKKLDVLKDVELSFEPGTITLVLGSPGCGKTTLLRALAGKLNASQVTGDVLFNGLPVRDVDKLRTVALVDQTDSHIPVLTVRETLAFADACQNGQGGDEGSAHYKAISKKNVDVILKLLGLEGCADTVVGDAKIRGVSGGQRRRATLGEILVSGVSVLLGDEISTGLDSSATLDIVSSLKSWAREMKGTVILALLQPPPRVVNLFDQIVLLEQGQVIASGTQEEVRAHFDRVGFQCPERKDFADFLQEITSPSGMKYFAPCASPEQQGSVDNDESNKNDEPKQQQLSKVEEQQPPKNVDDFHKLHKKSPAYQKVLEEIKTVRNADCVASSLEAVRLTKRGKPFANSFWQSLRLLMKREWLLTTRDTDMLRSLFGEALIVGALTGGIFFGSAAVQNYTTPRSAVGALFFALAILQRQAWQQIPILMRIRPTFYKQRKRDFFPTSAFVIAFTSVQIPINVMAMVVFTPLVYFMVGYTYAANTFLFYFLTMVLLQHALRAIFLCIGAVARNASSAQYSASLLVVCFLLFSGYILAQQLIPDWWIWIYWMNPLSYALRSLMLNEYMSPKYNSTETYFVLSSYGIADETSMGFLWAGPILLVCYFFLFNWLTIIALQNLRYDKIIPKTVVKEEGPIENLADVDIESQVNQNPMQVGEHKFTPVTLSFRKVSYIVKAKFKLLDNISGIFKPGEMTALMGSSGAGKTTLMDVIAGRKTQGKITGEIRLNGINAKPSDFSKISGYCEQMDIHSATHTVYEAFLFSANLRQAQEISTEDKRKFVDNVIKLLEMEPYRDQIIGESPSDGLSVSKRKLVTIGVELCANPAILFCDEPTSGLDAKAAAVLMRALRRVAQAQRTVVCTIHQPSASIFELFDNLLLLQKGGKTVYNGPLGNESRSMVDFFEFNGARKIWKGENPANYMLDVIGAGIDKVQQPSDEEEEEGKDSSPNFLAHLFNHMSSASMTVEEPPSTTSEEEQQQATEDDTNKSQPGSSGQQIDFHKVYETSPQKEAVESMVDAEMASKGDEAGDFISFPNNRKRATTLSHQFRYVSHKAFVTYWRSPQYNFKRMVTLILLALLFGTAYLFVGPVFPISTQTQARSFAALIYLIMDFISILLMVTVLPITVRERSVYYRERASQYYSSGIYMLAMFLVELPYLIVSVGLFCVVSYFLVGLTPSWFGYFYLLFWLYVSLCTFIGQLFAIATPNEVVGQILVGFTTVVFNLSSGYLVSIPNITDVLRWITYISPSSYAFNGLASTQLAYCPYPGAPYQGCNNLTGINMTLAEYAEKTFALKYEDIYNVDIPALFAFWVVTLILCGLSLKFINHDPR